MKVMKFHVTFDGYYGGTIDEYVLLPTDINGVLFEEYKSGEYDEAVYLGEIEGKHSECYGDLEVSLIDLDQMTLKDVTDLINNSDFDTLEMFFEGEETDYRDEYEGVYSENTKSIMQKYGIGEDDYIYSITQGVHYKFIVELKKKYIKKFKSITVLEEDYEKASRVLQSEGIKTF